MTWNERKFVNDVLAQNVKDVLAQNVNDVMLDKRAAPTVWVGTRRIWQHFTLCGMTGRDCFATLAHPLRIFCQTIVGNP